MAVALLSPAGDDRAAEGGNPAYASDWYLERRDPDDGSAVDPYRPIFQGDVFVGVPLDAVPLTDDRRDPALGEDASLSDAVMLVGHPCSMVAGSTVLPHQEVVRVRPTRPAHFNEYDKGRFEEFFLPYLDLARPHVHYSACLHERALVPTAVLALDHRVAALSLTGVVALQQRITNESSRVRLTERILREATWPQWHENELASEWNADVLAKDNLEGQALLDQLAVEAGHFDKMLGKMITAVDPISHYALVSSLREELRDPANQGRVNIAVANYRKQRRFDRNTARQQAAQRAQRELAPANTGERTQTQLDRPTEGTTATSAPASTPPGTSQGPGPTPGTPPAATYSHQVADGTLAHDSLE